MAAVDAVKKALERIAIRCADPKAKFFGLDGDLRVLGEALQQIQSNQRVIAERLASLCLVLAAAETHSMGEMLLDGIDRNAIELWSERLLRIAKGE